jgi:hypothetical protein
MLPLTNKNILVMEHLQTYRYLTAAQMVRLGVANQRENIYKILNRFKTEQRPLVQSINFGVLPNYGKLSSVHCLTRYGAAALAEMKRLEIEAIPYPKNAKHFRQDYFHRINTIDFHIELRRWAKKAGIRVPFFDTYFEATGSARKGNLELKTKVDLEKGALVPDANFLIELPNREKRLYTLEIHNGRQTKRTIKQLERHIEAIEQGSLSAKYKIKRACRVVSIYDSVQGLAAAHSRIQKMPRFQKRNGWFLLKTLDQVKSEFFPRWHSIDQDQFDFFKR